MWSHASDDDGTMTRPNRYRAVAVGSAFLAFVLITATTSAHAVDEPSPVHGFLDSGVIPAILAGLVVALALAWHRVQRGRSR